jgi:hypothetical protein
VNVAGVPAVPFSRWSVVMPGSFLRVLVRAWPAGDDYSTDGGVSGNSIECFTSDFGASSAKPPRYRR